jgi:hypothetical protein
VLGSHASALGCLLACFMVASLFFVYNQACRESARFETIQLLVEAAFRPGRSAAAWIAPLTGAEPWDDPLASGLASSCSTGRSSWNDGMPSFVPLAELWRRVHHLFDSLLDDGNDDDPEALEPMRSVTRQLLLQKPLTNRGDGSSEATPPPQPAVRAIDDDRTRAWASVVLLLRPHVASFETLLHAVVNIGLPAIVPVARLYEIICRLFPDLLKEQDAHQHLPLHAALHRPPLHGRFAAWSARSQQSGWSRDILPIAVRCSVEARPECAAVVDPTSQLLPALLAASTDAPVSVVYELLHASVPCLFGVK